MKVGLILGSESGTAERVYKQLMAKGARPGDDGFRSLSGMRVIAGSGFELAARTVCSVSCAIDALRIVPAGRRDAVAIPYESVTAADLAEGQKTAGGNYDYTSVSGNTAVDLGGEVLAGVLNVLSGKKTMLLRVVSRDGEVVLSATKTPEQMRNSLSRLFAHLVVDPVDAAKSAAETA